MKPFFLNVDLEVVSGSNLDSLAEAMGKRVIVLYCGPASKSKQHLLVLENARGYRGPDATIHALCTAVEQLAPAAHRIWNRSRKQFDVGYELRPSEFSSSFSLRPETLQRVAKLGATLTVTYYRGDPNDAVYLLSSVDCS